MNIVSLATAVILAAGLLGDEGTQKSFDGSGDSPWSLANTPLNRSADELSDSVAVHLKQAQALKEQIRKPADQRTIDNTLEPYNTMLMHLDAVVNDAALFSLTHPDEKVREAARAAEQQVQQFVTNLYLDRDVYEALKQVDAGQADSATQYFVMKTLRDFRRAGAEKEEDDREQIRKLNEQIVKTGQQFMRNIDEDVRSITLDSRADLAGLPGDWIEKHPANDDGLITVTTAYPDVNPFLKYARSPAARRELYVEFRNRGYPKNIAVLNELLTQRYKLARLLGYANYADYVTEDKMIESPANAQSFIDRVAAASEAAARRDYELLLARKREDDPAASSVEDWERAYYENLVKSERFDFDEQEARQYFNFDDVQQGIFDLTSHLFGVRYEPVKGLKLWDEKVTAWDLYDGDQRIARFYLDLHPRPESQKYGHAACFPYRSGVLGKQLPQAVLVCNFPDPADTKDGVALMEHREFETYLHEFGHLIHHLFAGRQRWVGNSGITTEWDFVEAPSQMLEEWAWDAGTLQKFAKHYKTREPIPADLVKRMRDAREFGKGVDTRHQLFYASVSLNFYNRDPEGLDTTAELIELQKKYSPFGYVEDTHFQCSFGHLNGYSSIYYTYQWSKVIARELLSRFLKEGLMNEQTAQQYRQKVLEPGGSKKAAMLVEDFLGRPYSFDAFEAWLNR